MSWGMVSWLVGSRSASLHGQAMCRLAAMMSGLCAAQRRFAFADQFVQVAGVHGVAERREEVLVVDDAAESSQNSQVLVIASGTN